MRWLFFILCLDVLSAQDYVCNLVNFRRMVGNVQIKVEAYYSKVVTSASEISDTLTYSSAHPNYFPGVYRVEDLTPCNASKSPDQWALSGKDRLLGVHVFNRTVQGIPFTWDKIEKELAFITPISNFLPTIKAHNPDLAVISIAGITLNCSTFYFYPGGDLCGWLPMMDICAWYNTNYRMFSKFEDLETDYQQGGHWSELYSDGRGGLTMTYSTPIKDAEGEFRAQLALGVGLSGISRIMNASKPSQNGYTFIMSLVGHLVYAQQPVIDILFGLEANLTLSKITSTYSGPTQRALSLSMSGTAFARLPNLLEDEDTNGSIFLANSNTSTEGYYVAWSRFEETLRTWFLVGIMPREDLDGSAVWKIQPSVVEVQLTDAQPKADITISAVNSGLLPVQFSVGASPHSRGVLINTSSERYQLDPNSSRAVKFTLAMEHSRAESQSFNMHLVTPFYSSPSGYGPCFRPQVAEMIVRVVRQQYYTPSSWALIVIFLLCGITAILVLTAYILLFCFRYSPPVLALAPRLCCILLTGLLFVLAAAVTNIVEPKPQLCEATRWFLNVGFTLAVSTITAKNYRNRLIFTSKKLQVVAISDFKLMMFILVCLLVDIVILITATLTEPYGLGMEGYCTRPGNVTVSLLVVTKILLWLAAFWNTLRISNIPSTFADTRLNGVFIIIALLVIVRMGLQFSKALVDNMGTQLFIGSLFMWFSAFLVWGHILLKLRSGYITVARPRSSTKNGSISLSLTQPKLKDRLETLLIEIEAQSVRLLSDKNNAIENVKANQRLMFEVRAELLAINTQAHLADEELERFLPNSIKSAFDKYGPAMARRMDNARPGAKRPQSRPTTGTGEARQLLSIELAGTSPQTGTSSIFPTPSTTRDPLPPDDQHRDLLEDGSNSRVHFTHHEDNSGTCRGSALKEAKDEEDMRLDVDREDGSEASNTQDEDTPLQRGHRT